MTLEPHDPLRNARRLDYRHPGFAARYHAFRPRTPPAIVNLLLEAAQTRRPRLVVDLGCGTGLSTGIWSAHADRVVGIEPLDEMRDVATAANRAPNVEFRSAVAQRTGLPDGAADIITASQSLHYLEPAGTLAEVARLLRAGGVFAAYDYRWPPSVDDAAERAFRTFMETVRTLRAKHGMASEVQRWQKEQHGARLRGSGLFREVRELEVRSDEPCSAERWVGFALSLGHVQPVLELGLSDTELGLAALQEVAARRLGRERLTWHVTYDVRIAVK